MVQVAGLIQAVEVIESATLPGMLNRLLLLFSLLVSASSVVAVDIRDTRMLADPAVSRDRIAFAYANDLWIANRDGSIVRRLTSHPGVESGPRFSPDGSLVAFT